MNDVLYARKLCIFHILADPAGQDIYTDRQK